ncbi:MAG: hypothetical protein GEU75_06420 [Dehalococcoidia bacterium]|nr:hypothetical protein [Dehalococcoidia bacterium]
MRAAVYCRVSTSGQAENGTSLESQRDACVSLAIRGGYTVQEEDVFIEDWSGADLERPKLERARERIRTSAVQALVCFAVDRLARDPIHVGIVAEECAKRGAELIFVVEPLDNSPEGGLIRYVKGYAAQIERERIKERTLRGKRSRARMGYMVQATGKGIYGFRYVPEAKKRVIYDPEAQVVQRIFQSFADGDSCYAIAVRLNEESIPAFSGGLWHPLTIKRMLQNSSYKGSTIFGKTKRVALSGKRYRLEARSQDEWIEIPGATPAIVSEEVFDRAQRRFAEPRRATTNASRTYLLTGFVRCSCGAPIVGTCLNRRYRYYRCRLTWPTSTRPKSCDQPYLPADNLESNVWKAVREILETPDIILAEIERQQGESGYFDDERARLRAAIRRLKEQERRLIRLFSLGDVTEEYLTQEIRQVKQAREGFETELTVLDAEQGRLEDLQGLGQRVRAYCDQVAGRLDEFDHDDKKLAFQALQVEVVVDRDGAVLKGSVPYDLATTERTSA